ncbi:hypothetical protein GCM10009425_23410 [Pseudomonas asuensis]|uniref:Uncharacterized protein n=1 Tax=Pseudomonas asuensis TaxID=1825787 RepID=A0ABQ2GSW5_9PSED|nr:hypothetical protein GCM10009425_23410 [Pseudomonas asuensis]
MAQVSLELYAHVRARPWNLDKQGFSRTQVRATPVNVSLVKQGGRKSARGGDETLI